MRTPNRYDMFLLRDHSETKSIGNACTRSQFSSMQTSWKAHVTGEHATDAMESTRSPPVPEYAYTIISRTPPLGNARVML